MAEHCVDRLARSSDDERPAAAPEKPIVELGEPATAQNAGWRGRKRKRNR
jgi:hypothetical protein